MRLMKYNITLILIFLTFISVSQILDKNIFELINAKKENSTQDDLIFDEKILINFKKTSYESFDFLKGNFGLSNNDNDNILVASHFSCGIIHQSTLILFRINPKDSTEILKMTFCDLDSSKLLFSIHYSHNIAVAYSTYELLQESGQKKIKERLQISPNISFLQAINYISISDLLNLNLKNSLNHFSFFYPYERIYPRIYIYLSVFDTSPP